MPVLLEEGAPVRVAEQRGAVISTRTSMRCSDLMPFEAWKALGAKIGMYANASAWWLGDWLVFGKAKYGRRYKDAIALTGLDYQTLRNYAVVARRFEPSRRRDDLTFQHHAEVCAMADEEQRRWLDLAAQRRWSRNELRRRIHAAAGGGGAAGVRLVVLTDAERERRWRDAAARSDFALEQWIVAALDRAAGVSPAETVAPQARPRSRAPSAGRRAELPGAGGCSASAIAPVANA